MTLVDKKGCSFEVKAYAAEDYPFLVKMYDQFIPKAKYQGMPPFSKEVRENWLKHLIEIGHNFLAWYCEEVVGHVVILPDFDKRDAEYLIFISQSHRGLGVGKALTHAAIERAKALDMRIVWLSVDAYNFRAVRLYRQAGFRSYEGYDAASERMMVLDLTKDKEA
jgi:RimJ/RimL family protein N-acetyltransferase